MHTHNYGGLWGELNIAIVRCAHFVHALAVPVQEASALSFMCFLIKLAVSVHNARRNARKLLIIDSVLVGRTHDGPVARCVAIADKLGCGHVC